MNTTSSTTIGFTQAPVVLVEKTHLVEQVTYEEHWNCWQKDCEGEMISGEVSIFIGWKTYTNHKCDKCGAVFSTDASFPRIVTRPRDKLKQEKI